MKNPAALTSRVASAWSPASCWRTRSTWSRSARSAVMPEALPSLASVWTVSSTLAGSSPMMTALPPAATTSSAVWRPIPLLPPTTTSFCPAKTGMAIGQPGRPSAVRVVVQASEPVRAHSKRSFRLGAQGQVCCLLTSQPGRRGPAEHRQISYR